MRAKSRRGLSFLVGVVLLALVSAACGGDGDDGNGAAEQPANEAEDAKLDELVAEAKKEGKVTIYSSQALDNLNAFGAAFKDKYGIDVEVVRGIDGELATKVEAEKQTGKLTVDLYVSASQSWVEGKAKEGWFVAPEGPHVLGELGDYDADSYIHPGSHFEVGAAVLTFAWNNNSYSKGLKSYKDLLDPALAGGKIGVIEPSAPSIVDFYLWLEETFGEQYVKDLAAQKPRIYPSALPMGEATISGEIFAASFGAPVQLAPAKKNGAPVEFGIDPKGAWGARYFGMVLAGAQHPKAAQLLADFMVTPAGQTLVMGGASTVVKTDIALLTNDQVRKQDLSALTPEKVSAYQAKWKTLFR